MPRTVLVIDDYPDTADSIAEMLALAGFRAHTALSLGEALDVAEELNPDVVVVDPLMDDGGGWEVAAWLCRRGEQPGPALLALTTGPCKLTDCRAAGFDFMVLKGDDPRTILAAVALCAVAPDL